MEDPKVHSVIPKPQKSMVEKLGLDEVNLNISLSDELSEKIDEKSEGFLAEARKTRMVLIVLGLVNALSFLVGKYAL